MIIDHNKVVVKEIEKDIDCINYFKDTYSACVKADLVIIMTEWNEFRDLQFETTKPKMNEPQNLLRKRF